LNPAVFAVTISLGFFIAMLACLEAGYRIGLRSWQRTPELAHEGIGTLEAAVFGLLGLLLAFAYAGGITRLDTKRDMIVREANAIGTAYLRLDLLPAADQPEMRSMFRKYLDGRLSVYEKLPDVTAAEQEMARVGQMQQQIWSKAIACSRKDPTQNTARLLLPALNDMIDITTTRTIALHTHLPGLIFALLIGVALLSGLLAGYAMAKRLSRSWLHNLSYAIIISIIIYSVLDLEFPRFGLIRLDAADNALFQLRDSIR
jgi:hypothetical protein